MSKRIVSGIILILLSNTLTLALTLHSVRASGTIYIRLDGSVDPSTAPILNVGNVYYTFTADIQDSIVIGRSNIIVDGNGHTLQGAGSGNGFTLSGINNVTIKMTAIVDYYVGIDLRFSHGNTLSSNTVTNNYVGIDLYDSYNNTLSGNTIVHNSIGIDLYRNSSGNAIDHNNFINNTQQVYDVSWDYPEIPPSVNTWDDGYPRGNMHACTIFFLLSLHGRERSFE